MSSNDQEPGRGGNRKGSERLAIPAFLRNPEMDFVEDLRVGHLSYEQIEGYVDRTLRSQDRTEVETHVRRCSQCAAEIEGVSELASQMAQATLQPAVRVSWRERLAEWWSMPQIRWLAAAACVVVAAGIFIQPKERSFGTAAYQARSPQVLRDGGVQVEVGSDGQVRGAEAYGAYAGMVRQAVGDEGWRPGAPGVAAEREREVTQLRQAEGEHHLLLGVVEANYGLLQAAERDFAELQAANPQSAIAVRLLSAVKDARRRNAK
jgi:hypothetical protein